MTANTHHTPVQGSKTPMCTFTPPCSRLSKYSLSVHFPDLQADKCLIPAGVDSKEVWGVSPLDACQWMAEHFRSAEWVEVER